MWAVHQNMNKIWHDESSTGVDNGVDDELRVVGPAFKAFDAVGLTTF